MNTEAIEAGILNNSKAIKVLKPSGSETCIAFLPFVGASWTVFLPIVKELKGEFLALGISPPGHLMDTEPPLDTIADMAEVYLSALEPYLKKNLILCGYSLGGLVSYCMLKKLRAAKSNINITIIIAASTPPHLIDQSTKISGLNDEQVIHFFHSIGGIPDILLKEKELLNLYLPILKSDYSAFENFKTELTVLNIPVFLIYGKKDNFINNNNFLQWARYFSNPPVVYYVNGGHMFIRENPSGFVSILQKIIDIAIPQMNINTIK